MCLVRFSYENTYRKYRNSYADDTELGEDRKRRKNEKALMESEDVTSAA